MLLGSNLAALVPINSGTKLNRQVGSSLLALHNIITFYFMQAHHFGFLTNETK